MSSVSAISSADYVSAAAPVKTTDSIKNNNASAKGAESKDSKAEKELNAGAVFEKSKETKTDSAKKTYTPNTELVAQLKAESDKRTETLRGIVEKLISGQSNSAAMSLYNPEDKDSVWKFFANGDFKNVDEAAIEQAKKDVAEGGYYSVEETSKRILDFAKALTGGNPEMIDKMSDAFKKGFEQATGVWGKDLPEISSKTYDAVMKGFEDWRNESTKQTETETALAQ